MPDTKAMDELPKRVMQEFRRRIESDGNQEFPRRIEGGGKRDEKMADEKGTKK